MNGNAEVNELYCRPEVNGEHVKWTEGRTEKIPSVEECKCCVYCKQQQQQKKQIIPRIVRGRKAHKVKYGKT